MKPLRTIIVDDEPLARERLRNLLKERQDAVLIAEARNGREAVSMIRRERPDLVLLDVQMPELDGFGVLEELEPAERPPVMFVTAYDRYAIQAFDLHALDYLLKPFDDARFHRAMERAANRWLMGDETALSSRLLRLLRSSEGEPDALETEPAGPGPLDRIAVRVGTGWHLVEVREVDWVEAASVYAKLVVGEKSYLLRTSLTELEGRLDPERFARIHRSTIVNLDRIKEVRAHAHGEYVLILKDGIQLKSSRTYSDRIRAYIERHS